MYVITLVFAWIGAPWSSRISIILTWPFLAAQCRGVSSSFGESIVSDLVNGASNHSKKTAGTLLMHLGFGINLSPSVQQKPDHDHIPPSGCNVQRSDTILQRKTDTLKRAHTMRTDSSDWDYIATTSTISYLWGKVHIGSSIEQQLSYIQVFIMCCDVEGCESSLLGRSTLKTCHTHYTDTKHRWYYQFYIYTIRLFDGVKSTLNSYLILIKVSH